jgi:hypothetical protein
MADSDFWRKLQTRFRELQPAQGDGLRAVWDALDQSWVLQGEPNSSVKRRFKNAVKHAAETTAHSRRSDALEWWFEVLKRETDGYRCDAQISFFKRIAHSQRPNIKSVLENLLKGHESLPVTRRLIAPLLKMSPRVIRNCVPQTNPDKYGNSFYLICKNDDTYLLEIRGLGAIPRVCEVSADYCEMRPDRAARVLQNKKARENRGDGLERQADEDIKAALKAGNRKTAVELWQQRQKSANKPATKTALYKKAKQHKSEYYRWERHELPDNSSADRAIRRVLTSD